jgi:hypothetical protein
MHAMFFASIPDIPHTLHWWQQNSNEVWSEALGASSNCGVASRNWEQLKKHIFPTHGHADSAEQRIFLRI